MVTGGPIGVDSYRSLVARYNLLTDFRALPNVLVFGFFPYIYRHRNPLSLSAYVAQDKEVEYGGSAPRVLSLDDYFITEVEKVDKDPESGKKVKRKVSREKVGEGSFLYFPTP